MGNAAPSAATFGFRVLNVQGNSPGYHAELVSFFDFIVAANGMRMDTDDTTFVEIIAAHKDKALTVTVYNCKTETTRDVVLKPNTSWGGAGLLGITIRYDSYEDAADSVLHVTDVHKGSPAQAAGLVAGDDYILGTTDSVFRDQEDLLAALTSHMDLPLDMFVYNAATDVVRHCIVVPSLKWGGAGSLGCELGHGYLHRLPADTSNSPGRVQPVGQPAGGGEGGEAGSRRVATPYGTGTFVRTIAAEEELLQAKGQGRTAEANTAGEEDKEDKGGEQGGVTGKVEDGAAASAEASTAPPAAGEQAGSAARTARDELRARRSSGGQSKAAADGSAPLCVVKLDWKLAGDDSALVTVPVSQITDIKPPPPLPLQQPVPSVPAGGSEAAAAAAAAAAVASAAGGGVGSGGAVAGAATARVAMPPVVAQPRPDAAHPAGRAVLGPLGSAATAAAAPAAIASIAAAAPTSPAQAQATLLSTSDCAVSSAPDAEAATATQRATAPVSAAEPPAGLPAAPAVSAPAAVESDGTAVVAGDLLFGGGGGGGHGGADGGAMDSGDGAGGAQSAAAAVFGQ